MKENIPEGTRAVIESNVFALNGGSMARSKCINNICWHIESLLEEQRKEILDSLYKAGYPVIKDEVKKDLLNQILSEAPEDRDDAEWHMICDSKELKGFNQANQQWRELLTKHLI